MKDPHQKPVQILSHPFRRSTLVDPSTRPTSLRRYHEFSESSHPTGFLSHRDAVKLRVENSKSYAPQSSEASCVAVPFSPQFLPQPQRQHRSPAMPWLTNKTQQRTSARKTTRSQNSSLKAKTNSFAPTFTPAIVPPEPVSPAGPPQWAAPALPAQRTRSQHSPRSKLSSAVAPQSMPPSPRTHASVSSNPPAPASAATATR